VDLNSLGIGVIDLRIGNAASVSSMLSRRRINNCIVRDPEKLVQCDRIILPGVGNFGAFASALRSLGFDEVLSRLILEKGIPILGICVGAQVLLEGSEESKGEPGLSFIPGFNQRIAENESRFIPRVGWDYLVTNEVKNSQIPLQLEGGKFYFTHSFKLVPDDESHSLAFSKFGPTITSIIRKGNVLGVQFHPEKSLIHGENFLSLFANGEFDVA
jgi:glutamine amidotransferase